MPRLTQLPSFIRGQAITQPPIQNVTTKTPITSIWGNSVANAVNELQGIGTDWKPYVPTVEADTNPNLGDAQSIAGTYCVIGSQCFWNVAMTSSGNGINPGNGAYYLTYPPVAPNMPHAITGWGWIYGAQGFSLFFVDGSGNRGRLLKTEDGANLSHIEGWTSPDHALSVNGFYRI